MRQSQSLRMYHVSPQHRHLELAVLLVDAISPKCDYLPLLVNEWVVLHQVWKPKNQQLLGNGSEKSRKILQVPANA